MNSSSEPLYHRVDTSDNVAVAVNRGGQPTGSRFSCGLALTEAVPEAHNVARVDLAEGASYMAESRRSSDFRMDWACRRFLQVLYVREGSGTLWTIGRKGGLQAPCVLLIPAGVRHRLVDTPLKPLSTLILSIRNSFVSALATEGGLTACRVIDHRPLCAVTKSLLEDVLYEQTLNHPGAEVLITGKVLELVGLLIRWHAGRLQEARETPFERGLSHARVAASIRHLEKNFNHASNLEETAERVGLKPRRYSQLFHLITGTSWATFLRHERVRHAKHLLIETDRSIVAISFECGFDDISSFYRAFSRVEGLSPNAWRKRERDRLLKSALLLATASSIDKLAGANGECLINDRP
jgi:AraC-like DNA-binding protein